MCFGKVFGDCSRNVFLRFKKNCKKNFCLPKNWNFWIFLFFVFEEGFSIFATLFQVLQPANNEFKAIKKPVRNVKTYFK